MARAIHRLTVLDIKRARTGKLNDGGGLYALIDQQSFAHRYKRNGKDRWHGLGAFHTVTLVAAREKSRRCRELLLAGIDPLAERSARKTAAKLDAAKALSFAECADRYHAAHRAGWRNAKHAGEWRSSLATHADPIIGSLPVQAIDTALVIRVLEPVWATRAVTAGRVRQRIEAVLDWARARGLRSGDNPARWRGHLDHLLPAQKRVARVQHLAALPYAEIGTFVTELRARDGTTARALEFAIMTAARLGEVLGATWGEIDLVDKVWVIPAARMKGNKDHRVPLSAPALALLQSLPRVAGNDHVFAGARTGQGLGHVALFNLLRVMGRGDITVHGFRSTFRDWAAEQTNYARDVCESALAHAIAGSVEAAYRRGDLLDKRRRLMGDWAKFCAKPSTSTGVVVPMHGRHHD
jgi:integrase